MATICRDDDLSLSLTGLDCLQIGSEDFLLMQELIKSFSKLLLTFMYIHFQKVPIPHLTHNMKQKILR